MESLVVLQASVIGSMQVERRFTAKVQADIQPCQSVEGWQGSDHCGRNPSWELF